MTRVHLLTEDGSLTELPMTPERVFDAIASASNEA